MISDFSIALNSLDKTDWAKHIESVLDGLKPELQTTRGFIRKLKDATEDAKNQKIDSLFKQFYASGTGNLDIRVDEFASKIERINDEAQIVPQYDLLQTIIGCGDLSSYPNLKAVQDILLLPSTSPLLKQRLYAVTLKVGGQSLSQGNKSNAGLAGEYIARAVLSSVGLVSGKHYREQYKSTKGSDTDFAFPCVNDFEDSKLEVLIAVQLSTNDRARLTTSELKQGVVGYVLTGNGLKVSTKSLSDIGTQIISSYLDANHKMVCHGDEIRRELTRISERLKNSPEDSQLSRRKKYFSENAVSFEDFANKMSKYLPIP